MADSLKKKTLAGIIWTLGEQFATTGFTFIFGILLARILAPSDYGVWAMLTVFFAVCGCFINSGFSTALIRKPDLREEDLSTAFYFNVGVSLLCYALIYAAAPWIAAFYNTPILQPIARVTGLNMVIGSVGIVPSCILTIRLDFKTKARMSIITTVITSPLCLYFAYQGHGVWAMVWSGLVGSFLNIVQVYLAVRWFPKTSVSAASFRYLFGFGSKLLASGLLDTLFVNIYPIVIGKFFSASTLGFYSRANQMAQLPSSTLTQTLQRVSFPVLSTIQNDDDRLATAYRKFLRLSAFIIFPLMVGLAAVADPLIRFLVTDKWAPSIPLLQVICFALMWYPIHSINLNLLQVKGRSDLFLKLEIIKKILSVSILCVTIPMGIFAMCVGKIVSSILCLTLNTHYTGKLIGLGYWRQMGDLYPILIHSLIAGAIAYAFQFFLPELWLKLLVAPAAASLYYVGINMLLRTQEWHDALDIIHLKRS